MKTSNKGIELIKQHEGVRLKAYKCPAGVWTIGYGHTTDVFEGKEITADEAEELLRGDLITAETEVNKVPGLNQNQFDALVSFTFNLGIGSFRRSTLRKTILENTADLRITKFFGQWVYAKGVMLPGLVRRRKEEAELYFS